MDKIEREELTVADLRPHVMSTESGLFEAIVARAAKAIERGQQQPVASGSSR